MRNSIRRVATLFMIIALVTGGMAAFAGSAAAETTTLAGDGSDHVTDYNASADDHLEYQLTSDDTDFGTDGTETVRLNITYNGHEYVATSSDVNSSDTSYTFNVSHDELKKLPGDATENTTVSVTAWGENADGNETTNATEFDAEIEFSDERTVRHITADSVDDDDVGPSVSSEEAELGYSGQALAMVGLADEPEHDIYTLDEESLGVTENTTAYVYAEGDVADAYDATAEDADDGDVIVEQTMLVDDSVALTYNGEASDNVGDGDTYAVYDADNDVIEIEPGDDANDSIEVSAANQNPTDFDATEIASADIADAYSSEFGLTGLMSNFSVGVGIASLGIPTFGLSLAGIAIVSRRRLAA